MDPLKTIPLLLEDNVWKKSPLLKRGERGDLRGKL
jgi:hypothetical protein